MPKPSNPLRSKPVPAALDRIDRAILAELQKDVRLTNKELAVRIGLAPSSCLERVRWLREIGALKGARAEVDPAVLGIELQALVAVQLRHHARTEVDAFRKHALSLRETVSVFHVAGAVDFLVHVAVRSAAHLRDLALDGFTARPEVARIETSLIFDALHATHLPDYLMPAAESPGREPTGSRGRSGRS
ncbi:MAG: Lrp/AsnC family transcriptional regulator [Planctomycetes bacterium]|nr:Lrp/AsnC family transcriptional regulator [Planctomycetota bacterium]